MPDRDPFGWVGETIDGKYRIESVVGEGGHAVVYRARHLGFDETVAVKCLKLSAKMSPSAREKFYERFLAEGRLLHQLSKQSADIVQAMDVGVATAPAGAWTPYLVLEWLEGETLEADLRRRAERGEPMRSLLEAVTLLEPAARGLAVAHEQGVAHRDIKPANLLVARVGGRETVKVVDFGIAKVLSVEELEEADKVSLTSLRVDRTAAHAFTARYAAPEHFKREYGATGPWTDVFALALVLLEVVTGRKCFEGSDAAEIYVQSCDLTKRPSFRDRGVKVSDEVEAVVAKALAVDPKRRYANATEMWEALTHAIPELRNRKASVRPGPSAPPPTAGVTGKHAARRSLPFVVVGIGLGVGAIVVVKVLAGAIATSTATPTSTSTASATATATSTATATASASATPTATDSGAPDGMVRVAAGAFTMGSDRDNKPERPAHRVVISRAYFIDRTEVTVEAYGECMRARACAQNSVHTAEADEGWSYCNVAGDATRAKHPVNCVDQEQAAKYCAFVGKRLPSEAEWERAARGDDARDWPWGAEPPATCWQAILTGVSGSCGGRKGTWEVGTTIDGKSPFGALDMAGNVFEWVADGFEPYPASEVTDPLVAPSAGAKGVLRGGSWDYAVAWAKTTARFAMPRKTGHVSAGFRCARSAE